MPRKRPIALALSILVMAAILLSACQGFKNPDGKAALTEEARLRARLKEFHTALGNNDLEKWYSMTTPAQRKNMTFEQFSSNLRRGDKKGSTDRQQIEAELSRVCSCVQVRDLRCVVIVDLEISGRDKTLRKERPLEMWEFSDREWYMGYIGADSRGRCPGER